MIVVKLMGGLGNQMFQYAFGKKLSYINNVPLYLDKSFLERRDFGKNFTYRNFDLDIFSLSANFLNTNTNSFLYAKEPHFRYSESVVNNLSYLLKQGNNVLIDGYWQSEKYFRDIVDVIKKDFNFINKIENDQSLSEILKKINNCNSVLINVRRTDYLNSNFHGVMGLEYIENAKKIIKSKIPNVNFFVFSDDIDWCNNNLKNDDTIIVDHSFSGYKFSSYLQLMSKCKHCIIPNSSFAWWAVYFNNNAEKLVIAPKNWFSDSSNIDASDIYLENWIKI